MHGPLNVKNVCIWLLYLKVNPYYTYTSNRIFMYFFFIFLLHHIGKYIKFKLSYKFAQFTSL